jgi:mRNA interferase RelE/StbE
VQVRLKPAIDGLAEEPRPDGVVKLKGEENAYRVRVGDYRIVYEVRDNVLLVLIVKIGHRREIYRK